MANGREAEKENRKKIDMAIIGEKIEVIGKGHILLRCLFWLYLLEHKYCTGLSLSGCLLSSCSHERSVLEGAPSFYNRNLNVKNMMTNSEF